MSHLNNTPRPRRIVAVGGGIAGWMAAAVLVRALERDYCEVQLIEDIAAAGATRAVGTLPSFLRLCSLLGIDAPELMQATHATFKLGAHFRDWGQLGDRYFHGFGPCGARLVPDSLSFKIDQFRQTGRVVHYDFELFATSNWLAALLGQDVMPLHYDPLIDQQDFAALRRQLETMRTAIRCTAEATPLHADYLRTSELIDA